MYKTLRYLFTVLLMFVAGVTYAAEESVTFSAQGYDNAQEVASYEGSIFSIAFDKGKNNNAPKYYNTGSAIRVYGGGTMTVSSESNITKIVLTFASGEGTNAISTNVGTFGTDTWTGEAKSVVFTVVGTSGHRRIASVTVTTAGEGELPSPGLAFDQTSFTLTPGEAFTAPSLTADDNYDGTITFASDNEDVATVDSETGEVTLTGEAGTAVITATAEATDNFKEGSASYTINVIEFTEVTIGEMATATEAANNLKLMLNDALVTYVNGRYIFVREDDKSIQFYNTGLDLAAGDVLNGYILMNFTVYNGMPEMTALTGKTSLDNVTKSSAEVVPVSATLDDVEALTVLNEYIKVEGLSIIASTGSYRFADDAGTEVAIYKRFSDFEMPEVEEGATYTVVGIAAVYATASATTPQIFPITVTKEESPVELLDPSLAFAGTTDTYEIELGDDFTAPELTYDENYDGIISYASDNEEVATVDKEGNVEIVGAGTAVITATAPATETFKSGSASYTIVVSEGQGGLTFEEVELPYAAALTGGDLDKFQFDNVSLGGLNAVWTANNTYGMQANGYKCTSDVEAWALSPFFNGTEATSLTLTFDQGMNYFQSTEAAAQEATLWVREGSTGTWQQVEIPVLSNANTFSTATIDLSAWAGKKFQVGFKYVGPQTKPGRWQIKNFSIVATADPELSFGDTEKFFVLSGNDFSAPELVANDNYDGTISFASSDESVATVDEGGAVTIVGVGTTVITATAAATENFQEGEASYTLVVYEGANYEMITSVDQIESGKTYLMVPYIGLELVGKAITGNYGYMPFTDWGEDVEGVDENILFSNVDHAFTFIEGDEGWAIQQSDGRYLAMNAKSDGSWYNNFNVVDEARYEWTFELDRNNTFKITNIQNNKFILNDPNFSNFGVYAEYPDGNASLPGLFRLQEEVEPVAVTIGATGYSTLYYSDVNLAVPEGVTASIVTAVEDKKCVMEAIDVIPAGQGVVLEGEPGDYEFAVVADPDLVIENNMLKGSDEVALTEGDGLFYMLSLAKGSVEPVGFYWGAENGAAFRNGAHKAYLVVPVDEAAGSRFFLFGGGEATGINGVEKALDNDAPVYTIGGVRVNGQNLQKGLYIQNGKKFVVK